MQCVWLLLAAATLHETGAQDGCTLQWAVRVEGYYLGGFDQKEVAGVLTEAQCLEACEKQRKFVCISAEYDINGQICTMSTATRDTSPRAWKQNPRFVYNERTDMCEGCHYEWSCRIQDYSIHDHVLQQLEYVPEEQCKEACVETGIQCQSITYDVSASFCVLRAVTNDYVANYYVPTPGVIYMDRRITCPGCHLQWTSRVDGYAVKDNNVLKLTDVTEEDCRFRCEHETAIDCVSIDYNKDRNYCYLSTVLASDVPADYVLWYKYTYSERTLVCPGCTWEWYITSREGWAIGSYNTISLPGVSEEVCKAACESELSFDCKSLDFSESKGRCYLSEVASAEVPLHFTPWSRYRFHERRRDCACPFEWTSEVNNYWAGPDVAKTVTYSSEEQCVRACQQEDAFECVALVYFQSQQQCLLMDARREDIEGSLYEHKLNRVYLERNMVCPGCFWEFAVSVENVGVTAMAYKEVSTDSVESLASCRDLCKVREDFLCKAVLYDGFTCCMMKVTKDEIPDFVVFMAGTSYHERQLTC